MPQGTLCDESDQQTIQMQEKFRVRLVSSGDKHLYQSEGSQTLLEDSKKI